MNKYFGAIAYYTNYGSPEPEKMIINSETDSIKGLYRMAVENICKLPQGKLVKIEIVPVINENTGIR